MSPRLEVEDSDLGQVVSLTTEGRGGTPLRGIVRPDSPSGGGVEWSTYSPTLTIEFGGIAPGTLNVFGSFFYQVLVNSLGLRLLQVQGKVQFDNVGSTFNGAFNITLPPGFTMASPSGTGNVSGYANLPIAGVIWPNNPGDVQAVMHWLDPGPGGGNCTVDVSFTVPVV